MTFVTSEIGYILRQKQKQMPEHKNRQSRTKDLCSDTKTRNRLSI